MIYGAMQVLIMRATSRSKSLAATGLWPDLSRNVRLRLGTATWYALCYDSG